MTEKNRVQDEFRGFRMDELAEWLAVAVMENLRHGKLTS
ncbi:MAG: hypothetical protein ACI9HK_001400 [Pirellulaceae bacterium]|jgi:hypothetical protein